MAVSLASLLRDRLHAAGLSDVTAVEPVEGGLAALAGLAVRSGGRPPLFVKSFAEVPTGDLFAAEVDLAHLWCSPHPPEATRFFDVYAQLAGLDAGWRARMPLIRLRRHLAVIAQFDHDWGAARQVRDILRPFRR